MTVPEMATCLENARVGRRPIPAFSKEALPTVEKGYEVQRAGLELALARGARVAGYKMGLTSRAKQRDVGVFEPIRGCLLAEMEVSPFGNVDTSSRIHPRLEPEVAVILKRELKGPGIVLREVMAALDQVLLAAEILDSRFENFSFDLANVVADNTSASGFVIGRHNWVDRTEEIRLMGVVLRKNGEVMETGAPAAVLGDPFLSVVSLANSLAHEGRSLLPGEVILTGGITASVPFTRGDTLEVAWPGENIMIRAV